MQKIPSEFVSKVTHDLKTPVGNAMMYAELMSEDINMLMQEHPEISDQLESLKYYCSNIQLSSSKLINSVQSWSYAYQIEDGVFEQKKSQVNLRELARSVIERNDIFIQTKNLEVSLDYESDVQSISVDQEIMNLILDNLLTLFIGMAPNNEPLRIQVTDESDGLLFRFFVSGTAFNETLRDAYTSDISIKEQIAPKQGILKPGGYALMFVNIALKEMKAGHGIDSEDVDPRSFWFRLPLT